MVRRRGDPGGGAHQSREEAGGKHGYPVVLLAGLDTGNQGGSQGSQHAESDDQRKPALRDSGHQKAARADTDDRRQSQCAIAQPFNVAADTGEDQRRTADAADVRHQHPGGGPEKQRQQRRRDQCKTRPADPLQESADHHRESDCLGDDERQRTTPDTVVPRTHDV